MMFTPNYLKNDIVLVRYPFSDLSGSKVRPAIVVQEPHPSEDFFIIPLTSRTTGLMAGEFVLDDWETVGLNVPTALKRGLYTVHKVLIIKKIVHLSHRDAHLTEQSLREWLGLR